jgi:hypothetical protein
MWFAEQFNTFLNLGECKEYPIMARSKSIPGSKTNRTSASTTTSNEQTGNGSQANLPDAKPLVAETVPVNLTPEVQSKVEAKNIVESRKMEVVKNESRKNVVPINLDDEIRRRAYELYQQRGSVPGSEAEDWLKAEREVRQRYRQQSA